MISLLHHLDSSSHCCITEASHHSWQSSLLHPRPVKDAVQSQQKAQNNHHHQADLFVPQNAGPDDQSLLLGPGLFPPECFPEVKDEKCLRTCLLSHFPFRLDTASLKRCRSVSEEWRDFIDVRVWGCELYKPNIIRYSGSGSNQHTNTFILVIYRKLWSDFDPDINTFNVGRDWSEKVTSVCCDDDIIYCGFNTGICRLFK